MFQYITIGIIAIIAIRFKTLEYKEHWTTNKKILVTSGILLVGMIAYECFNYKCMSGGFDGVPIGMQLLCLLSVVYFYIKKKT